MLTTLANAAWVATSLPAYRRFAQALRSPRATQHRLLRETLITAAGSAFAREHGLNASTDPATFRQLVPVRAYDELHPWIERTRRGEANVLTREPVLRLATSSGSTAAAKLLPQTASLQRQFNAAIGPWIVDLFRRYPSLLGGPAYWSVTPSTPPSETESAIPIGFDDDAAYLGGWRKALVNRIMAVPPTVARIRDPEAFWFATAVHLLRRDDLRLISVWHPSFLTLLVDIISEHWEALLREMPAKRARSLAMASPDEPTKIWPRLGLISCWTDAHAAGPAKALAKRFSGVPLQPKGLLATEAFVSLPFCETWPLAVTSHVLEFEDDVGEVHWADELEVGSTYRPIVTTAGGLWRYRLGDLVQVTGRIALTPTVGLVGRADHVVDLFGEKLSAGFVATVLNQLCPDAVFAMLAPGADGYILHVEGADVDRSALDSALKENPHYRHCRVIGQLQTVTIRRLKPGAYRHYAERLTKGGMRLGDIKPPALSPLRDWDLHLPCEML